MRVGSHNIKREDHNLVLKRIAGCIRQGTAPNFATGAFVDAINDLHTCLAYTALTGKRKQSLSDAEKLLSTAVANQCKKNEFP